MHVSIFFPDKAGDIKRASVNTHDWHIDENNDWPDARVSAATASALYLEAPSMMARSSPCYVSVRAMATSMARLPLA
jgi:hypothetical protein